MYPVAGFFEWYFFYCDESILCYSILNNFTFLTLFVEYNLVNIFLVWSEVFKSVSNFESSLTQSQVKLKVFKLQVKFEVQMFLRIKNVSGMHSSLVSLIANAIIFYFNESITGYLLCYFILNNFTLFRLWMHHLNYAFIFLEYNLVNIFLVWSRKYNILTYVQIFLRIMNLPGMHSPLVSLIGRWKYATEQ